MNAFILIVKVFSILTLSVVVAHSGYLYLTLVRDLREVERKHG